MAAPPGEIQAPWTDHSFPTKGLVWAKPIDMISRRNPDRRLEVMARTPKASSPTMSFYDFFFLDAPTEISSLDGYAPGTVTSVEIFDNGTSIGNVTVDDHAWSLPKVPLQPGVNTFSGIATNAAGLTSSMIPAGFTVETGIQGQPWSTYEASYDQGGNLVHEAYFDMAGSKLSEDYITTLANGDHELSTPHPLVLHQDNVPLYSETDLYSPDYSVIKEQTFFDIGTTTIIGMANKLTISSNVNDDITGGGNRETFVFTPYFGSDTIEDFKVSGLKHDTLSLPSADFSSIDKILQSTYMSHGHAIINVTDADEIILQNVTKAQLSANKSDFKLHD